MNKKRKIIKIVLATIVIAAAASYLLNQAAKSSWAYYMDVDAFLKQPKLNSTVRLAGTVKPDSIIKDDANNKVVFVLSGQTNSIEITYSGFLPKNFEPNREVVIQGTMTEDNKFKADQIITRCESKYKSKLKKSL